MSNSSSLSRVRATWEFIKRDRDQFSVQMMCRVPSVAQNGSYEWLHQPISNRGQEDARLLRLIRASFVASDGIYGEPRLFLDLRQAGKTCSKNRFVRRCGARTFARCDGCRSCPGRSASHRCSSRTSAAVVYGDGTKQGMGHGRQLCARLHRRGAGPTLLASSGS